MAEEQQAEDEEALHHHPNLKGKELLKELSKDIDQFYEEEFNKETEEAPAGKCLIRGASVSSLDLESTDGEATTKLHVYQSWQDLMSALLNSDPEVYLLYAFQLEKLFFSCNFLGEDDYDAIISCVDCLTEAVVHHEQPGAEIRYVSLMEILSTLHAPHWVFSKICEEVWDHHCTNTHEIPSNLLANAQNCKDPKEFRSIAYRVLMGLEWVPTHSHLREICGFNDDDFQSDDEGEEVPVPDTVKSIFHQIRSTPLPRVDNIHRLLNKFGDGVPNITVAITSRGSRHKQGLGKTTLAAMLSAHHHTQQYFTVIWLRLQEHRNPDTGDFDCASYTKCLEAVCDQLDMTPTWPPEIKTLEEPSLHKVKEDERMFHVKREMSRLIDMTTHKPLLVVLDDVNNDLEMEWFVFSQRQCMLVTTLSETLAVDWTLELEPLSQEEALELFLTEADYPATHVLSTSLEAKSIVHRCGFHPLCIRTASRWFRLKQVTAGVVKGLEELNQELSACTAKLRQQAGGSSRKSVSPQKVLLEVMNLMLSPVLAAGGQPTTLMKLCLCSMAVVFARTAVPLEAVHLLWGKLLATEESAIDELGDGLSSSQIRKRVRFISEALSSLGLLNMIETTITEGGDNNCNNNNNNNNNRRIMVEIHHELQRDFALGLIKEMKSGAAKRWHEKFASAYLSKKVECDRDGSEDKCRAYALEHLIQHMLKAEIFQKVAVLLKDERFLSERLDNLGFEWGTQIHIKDTKMLEEAMKKIPKLLSKAEEVAGSIFQKLGSFVTYHCHATKDSSVEDATKSIYLVGLVLAERGKYQEATSQFKTALKMMPKNSSSHATVVLFCISSTYFLRNENVKAMKYLKECLKVIHDRGESATLYSEVLMLKGDTLRTDCDYSHAMEFYEYALEKLKSRAANHRVEIGVGLARKGRLHLAMGDSEKAKKVLEEARDRKLEIGENSLDLASVYNCLGDILMEHEKYDDALEYYDKAYRLFEQHEEYAHKTDLLILNGKSDALSLYVDGCKENFELALESISKNKRPMMEQDAYDLRIIGHIYRVHDVPKAAMETLMVALQKTADMKEVSLERASSLCDLGNLYAQEKDTEGALQCFQESLQIREKKLGESEIVIETLLRIGSLYRANDDLDESMKFLNKALEESERVHGEKSQQVSNVLYEVADLKEEMGDTPEALAMFEECLDLRKRIHYLGPHPEVAAALEGIGKVHMKYNAWDRAYKSYAEGLRIRQDSMDSEDPAIAETLHILGIIARKAGDCERAMSCFLPALNIRKQFKTDSDAIVTLIEIGHVHRTLGDPDSALGCYHKCVEMVLEGFGDNDERLADVCLPLGHLHKELGIFQEAIACYEQGEFDFVLILS